MADTIPVNPEKLKQLRKAIGDPSQQEVARRSGLSRSFISDMESGRRQPRLLAARSLSQVYGVMVEDLCTE